MIANFDFSDNIHLLLSHSIMFLYNTSVSEKHFFCIYYFTLLGEYLKYSHLLKNKIYEVVLNITNVGS